MIRRYLLLALAVALLLHIGHLYFKVARGAAGNAGEAPSILYGRPTEIRKGVHLGNLRFTERLRRLSYRKVTGKPPTAGTFSEEEGAIRIFPRNNETEKPSHESGPVNIVVRDGRVVSLVSPAGVQMDSIVLEPEEIGRIMGPKMESRRPVSLSAVSPFLQNAVIASEDARFYSHIGIDVRAIGRALFANLRKRRFAQGGSTITQQLAKNFFLSPKKTLGRKLREAELALIIEVRYSKKQILEMYLNKIYFGQEGFRGIYGIEEAAGFYFSKQAKDISLEESALLAGIIRSPNRYSPLRNPKAAKERRNAVLARMRHLEMIREDEFHKASNAPVRVRPRSAPVHQASYFVDYIQRITAEELGGEKLYRTGYRYYTTLDPAHQAAAQEAVTQGLKAIEKTALPAGEPLQAALVAVDPKTGAMTAMVGGRDYGQTQFNRAADAKRQPGSAFKPFVLLTVLSASTQGKGDKTLSSIVSGEPVSLPTPEGMWTPSNFEGKSLRHDHDPEDNRGFREHRHRPAGERRRSEGSAPNRTCGGYHQPACRKSHRWHWGASKSRRWSSPMPTRRSPRGYPFRPISPLLSDHGGRRHPHGGEGSPGAGSRPASGIPYRVCAGGGAGARHGKIGKGAGDLLSGIGEDRNDGRQPGLLVRGVHPRRGLRRVGGL